MNRFIKKNLFLVGVLGLSALGVLVLLVLSVVQYIEMSKYIQKTQDMRETNEKLMRQRPPAVQENIELIQQDIDGYAAAAENIRKYFGQPLYPALEKFTVSLRNAIYVELRDTFKKLSPELNKQCEALAKLEFAQANIRKDLASLRSQLAEETGKYADLESELKKNSQLNDTVTGLRADIAEADKALAANIAEQNKLEKEIAAWIKKQLTDERAKFDEARQKAETAKSAALKNYNRVVELYEMYNRALTPAKLQENFRKFWEEEKQSQGPREQTYRRYRAKCGVLRDGDPKLWEVPFWEKAAEEFIKEAAKTTIEKIDERNSEEIFLSSLGLLRNMGKSQLRLEAFAREMQKEIVERITTSKDGKHDISMLGVYFGQRTIPQIRNNKDFVDQPGARSKADDTNASSSSSSAPSGGGADNGSNSDNATVEPSDVIRNWEIISDIAGRIISAQIDSVEDISYSNLAGREENGCRFYTYSLAVTGSEEDIRNLLNLFNDAYKENRIYVMRNFSITKQEDQIQNIIDAAQGLHNTSEEAASMEVKGNSNADSEKQMKKALTHDEYLKRNNTKYECVAGRSSACSANIILDYVVYSANILK